MSLNLAKYKILNVDDVREMRMSLTSLTKSMGAQHVIEASSGEEAMEQLQSTVFSVADDGKGFTREMLDDENFEVGKMVSTMNSPGLGLHFANRIAQLHRHRDRCGRISLTNSSVLGGGEFRLWLP